MHHPVPDGVHDDVRNGMPARELGRQDWHRPWSDDAGGACVEVKKLADGRVAVRQSTDPDGPALLFTPREMTSFLAGVKAGEADFLL
ncbi:MULTISPECIES: DUF397 domain-containing protein [Streptomyces]|uniref:Putative AbaA-like regulatory protein n=1 Tax=Streptomyces scabiei (strain 87.22) TaxID=680198 RepID=C9YUQ8_STRSW|nr:MULTISPECIES: DUF397 domain-containing protein [Streptomyces]KFG09023.1 toxin-antitoxin system, toxin component [Streptomyces scabiei]MBP5890368.1 DUF397 domain-containing protein [Streptomyces sp. LBUM 1481]MBP5920407.1 DUF397 domain-containing protein [Streptomyces sp. LBUM 1483]MDX2581497.1 DUF397 domain-containing protein [Streptomyces scabiei]MDX2658169.1 DUF397 domain-containing protein [Streptomyces scabiei]